MADSVEAEHTVATGNRDVMEAMVEPATVAQFCSSLLPVVVRVTRSDLGAFYLPTGDGRLIPASSVGLSAEALGPFDLTRLEGALGEAVASGKVTHVRGIPEDTRFTFRTVAGTAVPRELLTIPVVVQEKLVAVLALASLREYPPEALAIVDKSLVAFGFGFSNILVGEETRTLAGELSARNAELTAQGMELSAQAQELARQSAALRDQNVELEAQAAQVAEANRMKSEFLSNMSHELRTPLNSVLALSRVLQMRSRDRLTAEEAGYLEIIERNGKQLLSLINDVLDLAKIESGRADVLLEEVVAAERIRAIAEPLEPICREKGIGFVANVEEGLPPLVTDTKRFHQILQNVIGNAVKFTREGSVTVTAERRGGELEIVVADTGIGIPEKDLPHIFEEFRQVDGTTSRSFEGTGLGLAIASRSAHLLGGRIRVRSVPGAGSTFTISLPFSPAPAGDPAAHPADRAAAAAWRADGRRTVLVVDDDPEDAALVAAHLSREGFATLVAHGGREALRLAREHRPFAITLDILMPEMDGWEVLQALKASPETAAIPVIVVSMSPDRETGLALGAVGVVAKPVDPAVLVAELSRVAPAPASILVVDDDERDRTSMAGILESAGYEVRLAASGTQALALAAERVPDAITLDLVMPGMNGFEVL
jgi:signal transduction histidine kinase/DNA-binding response OmpR family regulator